ncbi:MAG: hypothetical protein Q9160_005521 [Pyrenula sp. 1 TL-2023]
MHFSVVASISLFVLHSFAHPTHRGQRPNLHRRTVDINRFRLQTKTTYVNSTVADTSGNLNRRQDTDYVQIATDLVKKIAPDATFRVVDDHYVGKSGIAHVNFKQTANDLDIDNADFNVNVGKDGKVFSYGNSFFTGEIPSALRKRQSVAPVQALQGVNNALDLSISTNQANAQSNGANAYTIQGTSGATQDPKAKLVYFQNSDNILSLAWRVETDIYSNWLLSYGDAANTQNILGVVDYSADATYQVYPWQCNDPDECERELITDPWDSVASEFTWQGDGFSDYPTTRGNNGIAQTNRNNTSQYISNPRPNAPDGQFVYPYSPNLTDPNTYGDASVTQLFYTANKYHDLLYQLGFTEAAGNFEVNNDGQGGVGQDFVILNAQDGSGKNNANFATPPDGQSGRMRMYLWNYTAPVRDCTFEAGVIIHEYTHGLSNRLTGGPANTACLNVLEAGGMGEGWGDFMATAIRTKTTDTRTTDYPLGAWVYGKPQGLRQYVYSTSLTTNPLTYGSNNALNEVHALGTTWATMLYEMMWNLVDAHGINGADRPSFDANGVPTDGRYLAMQLVVDGMALQPCNPTFIQARDAIIDADVILTGGENRCAIWTAFAKRGLGSSASRGPPNGAARVESYDIPGDVC